MKFGFLFSLALNFAGLVLAARLFTGIEMAGFGWAALAAFILTLLHLVVRPIFILFTLPLTVISMGLFLLIINGLMFWLAGSVLDGYQVHGFASAIGGAVVVSLLGMLANWWAAPAGGPSGQKVRFYTFSSGGGRASGGGRVSQNSRPLAARRDEDVVDLEVDESGEWKIKD